MIFHGSESKNRFLSKSSVSIRVLRSIPAVLAMAAMISILAVTSIYFAGCAGAAGIKTGSNETTNVFFDAEAGLSFAYPSRDVTVSSSQWMIPDGENNLLVIQKRKIDEIGEEETNGYDMQTTLADMSALEEGDFGEPIDFPFPGSENVLEADGVYLKEFAVFARFEICDVTFERICIFYKDGYQFIINLKGSRDAIVESNRDYFIVDKDNCGDMLIWNLEKQQDFHNKLKQGEASQEAINWYSSFDDIVSSISFSRDFDELAGRDLVLMQQQVRKDSTPENYSIMAAYPEFAGALESSSLDEINGDIDAMVNGIIEQFIKSAEEMAESTSGMQEGTEEEPYYRNSLQLDYSLPLFNNLVLSSLFTEYFYTGGAHGGTNLYAYNYDFKNGTILELNDIFAGDFDYPGFLSSYCIEDIKKQQQEQGLEPDVSWIEDGASPDIINFSTFILLQDALVIKFAEYQVAPYAAGIVSVSIPFAEFEDNIDPKSPIADM